MASCTIWWLVSPPEDADPQQTWHSHLPVCQQGPGPLCNMTELSPPLVLLIFSGHCYLTEVWCGGKTIRVVPTGTRELQSSADHDPQQKLGKMLSPGAAYQLQHRAAQSFLSPVGAFPQGHLLSSYVCRSC